MASHDRATGAGHPEPLSSPASGWLRAGTVSIAAHALLLLAIGFGAWMGRGRVPAADLTLPALPLLDPSIDVAIAPSLDLAVPDDVLPPATPPDRQVPAPTLASDAPASDSPVTAVPLPGPEVPRPPATDSGNGAGRSPSEVAWRRDRSTLRDRLANGAERYQPAHSLTARAAVSPQADRREPRTGLGDAPRSLRAAGNPALSLGMLEPDAALRGGDTAQPGAPESPPVPMVAAPPSAATDVTDREGPLDTTQGARAFDVARRGPAAADDRAIREASAELHPSVTDLSAPSAPGASNEGHGPAAQPGPMARPVPRAGAPSQPGHLGPLGGNGAGSARERAHAHYETEIRARVNRALVFPRSLAVRLLLGETMLSFAVASDGHLDGPVAITKSAGYEEFDRAAVDAVRRAAPFPALPPEVAHETKQARSFSLRVTFSNPVIR